MSFTPIGNTLTGRGQTFPCRSTNTDRLGNSTPMSPTCYYLHRTPLKTPRSLHTGICSRRISIAKILWLAGLSAGSLDCGAAMKQSEMQRLTLKLGTFMRYAPPCTAPSFHQLKGTFHRSAERARGDWHAADEILNIALCKHRKA
ncbi:hypothetical protein CIHG_02948 [Coccidioides immitis H538.4]|uniref:Uncharacterized protein n=2 Tax=Coccidioides immitis TaxID=5501 RepID=A0A0J8R1F5_COCIT|nr:hypothetical protein CISG_07301 [Coccidioides immitis RMSCC 3703]KMU85166.1 hypothetical protein CIHG_02948 [Coccidioides immitis H538.4]